MSDQLNEETEYDLNTPQMHANLHSEFLKSVSNKVGNDNNKKVNARAISRNKKYIPDQTNTKRYDLLNKKTKAEGSNSSQVKLANRQNHNTNAISGNVNTVLKVPKSVKVIKPKECRTLSTKNSKSITSMHEKNNFSCLPLSERNKAKPNKNKIPHVNDSSKVPQAVSSRKSNDKIMSMTNPSKPISNPCKTNVKAKSNNSNRLEHSHGRVLTSTSNLPVARKIKYGVKVKCHDSGGEVKLSRMDTIKEEELKEVPISTSNGNTSSKVIIKTVPVHSVLETKKDESATQETDLNSTRGKNDKNKMKLKELEKIETDFVSFLLPWLKLVPHGTHGKNSILVPMERSSSIVGKQSFVNPEENKDKKAERFLKNLSKV